MIIRLTPTQWAHIEKVVAHDHEISDALHADVRQTAGVARLDVIAPFAAWVFAREALLDQAFNDRGMRKRGVPTSLQAAVKTVAGAIGHIERHPCLRQQAVFGHVGFWLPVWRIEPTDKGQVFHPYPQPGREFLLLRPVWERSNRQPLTYWSHDGDGHAPFGEHAIEETHLRLWRQEIAAAARSPHLDRLPAD